MQNLKFTGNNSEKYNFAFKKKNLPDLISSPRIYLIMSISRNSDLRL